MSCDSQEDFRSTIFWDRTYVGPAFTLSLERLRSFSIFLLRKLLRKLEESCQREGTSRLKKKLVAKCELKNEKTELKVIVDSIQDACHPTVDPGEFLVECRISNGGPVEVTREDMHGLAKSLEDNYTRRLEEPELAHLVSVFYSVRFLPNSPRCVVDTTLIHPTQKFQLRPLEGLPVAPSAMLKSLEETREVTSGFLVMDERKQLVPMLRSDKKIKNAGRSLVGVWMSGLDDEKDYSVWLCLLQYACNRRMPNRTSKPTDPFVLVLSSPSYQHQLRFFECQITTRCNPPPRQKVGHIVIQDRNIQPNFYIKTNLNDTKPKVDGSGDLLTPPGRDQSRNPDDFGGLRPGEEALFQRPMMPSKEADIPREARFAIPEVTLLMDDPVPLEGRMLPPYEATEAQRRPVDSWTSRDSFERHGNGQPRPSPYPSPDTRSGPSAPQNWSRPLEGPFPSSPNDGIPMRGNDSCQGHDPGWADSPTDIRWQTPSNSGPTPDLGLRRSFDLNQNLVQAKKPGSNRVTVAHRLAANGRGSAPPDSPGEGLHFPHLDDFTPPHSDQRRPSTMDDVRPSVLPFDGARPSSRNSYEPVRPPPSGPEIRRGSNPVRSGVHDPRAGNHWPNHPPSSTRWSCNGEDADSRGGSSRNSGSSSSSFGTRDHRPSQGTSGRNSVGRRSDPHSRDDFPIVHEGTEYIYGIPDYRYDEASEYQNSSIIQSRLTKALKEKFSDETVFSMRPETTTTTTDYKGLNAKFNKMIERNSTTSDSWTRREVSFDQPREVRPEEMALESNGRRRDDATDWDLDEFEKQLNLGSTALDKGKDKSLYDLSMSIPIAHAFGKPHRPSEASIMFDSYASKYCDPPPSSHPTRKSNAMTEQSIFFSSYEAKYISQENLQSNHSPHYNGNDRSRSSDSRQFANVLHHSTNSRPSSPEDRDETYQYRDVHRAKRYN